MSIYDGLDSVFFSEDVASHKAAILGETVYGYLDAAHAEALEIAGTRPQFTCAVAHLPEGVADGTAAAVAENSPGIEAADGTAYVVRSIQPDGTGAVTLVLEES